MSNPPVLIPSEEWRVATEGDTICRLRMHCNRSAHENAK